MNYNEVILLDFESTGKNASTCQPVQLSAIAINGRKWEIIKGSEFNSLIKPIFDEEKCKELNLAPLTQDSIAIHGKTKAMLETAPDLESVWKNFVNYVNCYNFKKSPWFAPIFAGYNSRGYDSVIVDRICKQYGPLSKEGKQGLFHPIHHIDLMDQMFLMTENMKDVTSLSVDNLLRKYMGWSKGIAHDSMHDVELCAHVLVKNMQFFRSCTANICLKDSLKV